MCNGKHHRKYISIDTGKNPCHDHIMNIIIRPENSSDYDDITAVNDLAFGQTNEGVMIRELRKNKAFIPGLSLVAMAGDELTGHILFFPVPLLDGAKRHDILSLAPMAVLPEYQYRGIGSRLVRSGLEACMKEGFKAVHVLGHADYYPRFGFKRASKWHIRLPFDAPDKASMAIELVPGGLAGISGTVEYPKEYFGAL